MNGHLVYRSSVLLVIVMVFSGIIGCSGDSGKLPITTSSEDALEYYLKGREYYDKYRVNLARDYLIKAIEADSNFALAYLELSFASSGESNKLFAYLEKAVSLVDNVSEGERLMILGWQASVSRDPQRAGELFRHLVELYPNCEKARSQLGHFYFEQREYELAIGEFSKAIEINDKFAPPYNMLGYSYRYLGDYEKAEQAFQKYIELIPNDPNPYDSYAELKMKMGDYGLSIESYYKALEIDSTFYASHIGIASNLNFLGKHKDARDQIQELYDATGDYSVRIQALNAMVISYVDEGLLDKALDEIYRRFKLAAKADDYYVMSSSLATAAIILFEMGEIDRAEQEYAKAQELVAQSNLSEEIKTDSRRYIPFFAARFALARNDIQEAKVNYEEYSNLAELSNNPSLIWRAHFLAGLIAMAEKDYDKAIGELNQSNLYSPYRIYHLAMAYEGKGDFVKARETYKEAANYNVLNDINYAIVRLKAHEKYRLLSQQISLKQS